MKLTDLEDYSKLENALERIDLRFDRMETRIDKLDAKIDKLDAKIDKLKASNWLPSIVIVGATVVQVAALIVNHVWPK
jgi:phage shock protein A